MRKARKRIECRCGAFFKVSVMALRDSLAINCPACGQKIAADNPDLESIIDNMMNIKSQLADYGVPFHTLAHYTYNSKYNKRVNPLEKYNILID